MVLFVHTYPHVPHPALFGVHGAVTWYEGTPLLHVRVNPPVYPLVANVPVCAGAPLAISENENTHGGLAVLFVVAGQFALPAELAHVAVPASKVATPVVPLQYMRAEPVLPDVVVATYPE